MSGAVRRGKVWLDTKVSIDLEGIRMPANTPRRENLNKIWICKLCGIKAISLLELYQKHKLHEEDPKDKEYCRTAVPEYVDD